MKFSVYSVIPKTIIPCAAILLATGCVTVGKLQQDCRTTNAAAYDFINCTINNLLQNPAFQFSTEQIKIDAHVDFLVKLRSWSQEGKLTDLEVFAYVDEHYNLLKQTQNDQVPSVSKQFEKQIADRIKANELATALDGQEKTAAKDQGKVEKIKIPSQNSPQKKQVSYLDQMRTAVDKLENITWYQDKETPKYHSDRNALYLYFGNIRGKLMPLRIVVQTTSDSWLFAKGYAIFVDGEKFDFPYVNFERDNYTDTWEWSDAEASQKQLKVVDKIISSKEAAIRVYGQQYHRDFTITIGDKLAFKRTLLAYGEAKKSKRPSGELKTE